MPATDVLGYGPLSEDFDAGQAGLQWGIARAFADPPEKLLSETPKVAFETSVTNAMMQVWQAKKPARHHLAYMIPGQDGVESFNNGKYKVKVTVVTNSLAATDEPLVHNGYSKYRPALNNIAQTHSRCTGRRFSATSAISRWHAGGSSTG